MKNREFLVEKVYDRITADQLIFKKDGNETQVVLKVDYGNDRITVPTKALLEAIIDVELDGVDVITDDTIRDMSAQQVAEIALQLGYKLYSQIVDYTFESCVIHHVIDKRPDRVAGKETAG